MTNFSKCIKNIKLSKRLLEIEVLVRIIEKRVRIIGLFRHSEGFVNTHKLDYFPSFTKTI
jgi:hypothetical protein